MKHYLIQVSSDTYIRLYQSQTSEENERERKKREHSSTAAKLHYPILVLAVVSYIC